MAGESWILDLNENTFFSLSPVRATFFYFLSSANHIESWRFVDPFRLQEPLYTWELWLIIKASIFEFKYILFLSTLSSNSVLLYFSFLGLLHVSCCSRSTGVCIYIYLCVCVFVCEVVMCMRKLERVLVLLGFAY